VSIPDAEPGIHSGAELERRVDPEVAGRLERFYTAVAAADLAPLWTQTRTLMPNTPSPATRPWLWEWSTLRALAADAGELITIERGGERRVLALANPGLDGAPFATSTLWGAVQYLGPRESAPAHRHTPAAIRFVLEGEGVWTTVDGDACTMHPGDLVLTPGWTFHDHENDGDEPMLWFDGLDMPLVIALDAVFYENHPELRQPVRSRDHSLQEHRGGALRPLPPVGAEREPVVTLPRASPLLVYRWADTDAALDDALSASSAATASVEFVDPTTGRSVLPTLACEMHRLTPQAITPTTRRAGSAIFVVHRGSGSSVIQGVRFHWTQGDMFVAPSWAAVEHESARGADLFAISDRPALEALSLYREMVEPERQTVTSDFGSHR